VVIISGKEGENWLVGEVHIFNCIYSILSILKREGYLKKCDKTLNICGKG
jgi:hypothetical protein